VATKGSELATVQASDFAIMQADPELMSDILNDNLGGGNLDIFKLKRIKTPSSGMTLWTLPVGAEGEEHAATFDAIILYQKPGRTFYRKAIGEGASGQPPDCSSADNATGYGKRWDTDTPGAHDCQTCPLAQWQGRTPPPCHEQRTLFLLRERDMLPVVMIVPRTGLKAVSDYMLGLSYEGASYVSAVTRFGLVKKQNQNGTTYAQVTLAKVGTLAPEEVARVRAAQAAVRQIADARVPAYAAQQQEAPGGLPEDGDDMTDETL